MKKYDDMLAGLDPDALKMLAVFENELAPLLSKCYKNPSFQLALIRKLNSLCEHDSEFTSLLLNLLPPKKKRVPLCENEEDEIIETIDLWYANRCESARDEGKPEPTKQQVEADICDIFGLGKKTVESYRTRYNKKHPQK